MKFLNCEDLSKEIIDIFCECHNDQNTVCALSENARATDWKYVQKGYILSGNYYITGTGPAFYKNKNTGYSFHENQNLGYRSYQSAKK